jgi:GNAT superfamily N-acetyltransferase
MSADVILRDATEVDLPRLVALLNQLSLDDPREDRREPLPEEYVRAFREVEADPRQRVLVVEIDGEVTGTALLMVLPNISHLGRPYAIVEDVVIDDHHRDQGYGEALMRHMMALAKAAGCYKLTLTSNKARANAHRFYRRLGFTASHEGFRIDF